MEILAQVYVLQENIKIMLLLHALFAIPLVLHAITQDLQDAPHVPLENIYIKINANQYVLLEHVFHTKFIKFFFIIE